MKELTTAQKRTMIGAIIIAVAALAAALGVPFSWEWDSADDIATVTAIAENGTITPTASNQAPTETNVPTTQNPTPTASEAPTDTPERATATITASQTDVPTPTIDKTALTDVPTPTQETLPRNTTCELRVKVQVSRRVCPDTTCTRIGVARVGDMVTVYPYDGSVPFKPAYQNSYWYLRLDTGDPLEFEYITYALMSTGQDREPIIFYLEDVNNDCFPVLLPKDDSS